MSFGSRTTITSNGHTWIVTWPSELAADERTRLGDAGSMVSLLDDWFHDPETRPDLIGLYEKLSGDQLALPPPNDADPIKAQLRQAFERGELVALRLPSSGSVARSADVTAGLAPTASAAISGQRTPSPPASIAPPRASSPAPIASGASRPAPATQPLDAVPAAATTAPRPPTFFEARFVDELNEPLAGLDVTFHFDGQTAPGTTDANGVARLDNVTANSSRVEVRDVDQLRARVKERWDKVRPGARLTKADGVVILLLHDALEQVQLDQAVRKTISIQPRVVLARLFGLLFDTDKNFLLPAAIPTIQALRAFYADNPSSALLVVGHTDTAGRPTYNDPLSLERADAMKAFLTNAVDVWLARFKDSVSSEKRWGKLEESQMTNSVLSTAAFSGASTAADPVLFFQQRHNQLVRRGDQDLRDGDDSNETADATDTEILDEDGKLGERTRRALIRAYMRHDRTTLPAGVVLTTHGCGENFPLDASATTLDSAAKDDAHEQKDRRVELFFFDGKLGVQPRPPERNSKKDSKEYPEWRRRAVVVKDLGGDQPTKRLEIRLINNRDEPLAGVKYRLTVGTQVFDDVADNTGTLRQNIPGSAKSAVLALDAWTVSLEIGELNDSAGDSKARLNNLGLFAGADSSDTLDDLATRAIARFQMLHGLNPEGKPPSGQLDAATKQKLREQHGS